MKLNKLTLTLVMLAVFFSCSENPFTGKKTLALVPNSQLFPTSFAQYNQFLGENRVVNNTTEAEMITRVGQRIAIAAELQMVNPDI